MAEEITAKALVDAEILQGFAHGGIGLRADHLADGGRQQAGEVFGEGGAGHVAQLAAGSGGVHRVHGQGLPAFVDVFLHQIGAVVLGEAIEPLAQAGKIAGQGAGLLAAAEQGLKRGTSG